MALVNKFQTLAKAANENAINQFVEECFNEFYEDVYLHIRYRYKRYPEDIAQQTFKRFYTALSDGLEMSFKEDKDIRNYLKKIASNLCLNEISKPKRLVLTDDFWEGGATPYPQIDFDYDFTLALRQLSLKEAEVVMMRYQGYKFQEIADKIGSNKDAVKQVLYRCRDKLKVLLD